MEIWDQPSTDPTMHMCRLFAGRTDAVGATSGGCVRISGATDFLDAMRRHLNGEAGMGAYCFLPDGTTTWGCIDIDTSDIGLSRNIMRLLAKLGVTSWLEVSRSKGYHVWLFASSPVPVKVMRDAQLAVGQMLGADLKECNPKQYTLPDGAIGNYVRLPYLGGALATPERQVIVDPETMYPIPLAAWVRDALQTRNSLATLQGVAALYRPPVVQPVAPPTSTATVTHSDRYVAAALQGEYQDVSCCASGGRNHRLYQSAMKLGRFLASQQAEQHQLESVLLSAAQANGLVAEDGEHAVMATIRSGLRNGAART
jgi:hypothetical protein